MPTPLGVNRVGLTRKANARIAPDLFSYAFGMAATSSRQKSGMFGTYGYAHVVVRA